MSIFGGGSNLPPGCRVSDIPGNRPEDAEWEAIEEHFWDKKRIAKRKYGIQISPAEKRAMSLICKAKKYSKVCAAVETYIIAAIEYGMEIGAQQERDNTNENLGYDKHFAEERIYRKTTGEYWNTKFEIKNDGPQLIDIIGNGTAPSWNAIDAQVAHDTKCPKCGKLMCYMGFKDKKDKKQISFALCKRDGFAIEF